MSSRLALIVASLWLATGTTVALADRPEGRVAFFKEFRTAFDPYIEDPSASERQWMVDQYTRIKAFSPRFDRETDWFTEAWSYKNTYAVKPGSRLFRDHPEWILRDRNGTKLYIPYECSGGTCPQYAGDFGNQAFRDRWIDEARDLMDQGYSGLWIDDVNMTWRVSDGYERRVLPIDPRTGSEMTLQDWRRYMRSFMEQIRDELPRAEIAHNMIWYAGDRENTNRDILRQIDAADFINLERGVTDHGLTGNDGRYSLTTFLSFIDMVHERGRDVVLLDEATTRTQRQYALAGWLLISNGNDLMGSENTSWTVPDSWWAGYNTDLGNALGDRYSWRDLIRRDFECGIVLLNPPDRARVSASLGRTVTTLDGNLDGNGIDRVSIGGDESSILLHECAAGSPTPTPAPDDGTTVAFQDGVSPSASYRGTRDVTLSQAAPNRRAERDPVLEVDGDDPRGTGDDLTTLLKWDLSAIPDDAVIRSAVITLQVTNPSNSTYNVFAMHNYWLEHQATWNERRKDKPWNSAGADAARDRGTQVLATIKARSSGSLDVPLNAEGIAVVQGWVAGNLYNEGFGVANSGAGDGLDFASREASSGRPKLKVTYTRH